MGNVSCDGCGAANESGNRFCIQCGNALETSGEASTSGPDPEATRVVERFSCPKCGASNEPDARYCMVCGAALRDLGRETQDAGDDAGDGSAESGRAASPEAPPAANGVRPPGETTDAPPSDSDETRLFVSLPVAENGKLVRLLPDGGREEYRFEDELVVGRTTGDVRLPEDPYLSERHAVLRRSDGGWEVADLQSTNGTFVRIDGEVELRPGDRILIGGQILEFVA